MPIPLLGAMKGLLGGGQLLASLMGGSKRPEYTIPPAFTQALEQQRMRQYTDMPGMETTQGNIFASTANAIDRSREGGNPLGALASVTATQNKSLLDLGVKNQEYRDRQKDQYQSLLQKKGEYQDRAFQMNKFAPFADKKNLQQNMFGSGVKNIFGAVDQTGAMKLSLMRMMQNRAKADGEDAGLNAMDPSGMADMFGGDNFMNMMMGLGTPQFSDEYLNENQSYNYPEAGGNFMGF